MSPMTFSTDNSLNLTPYTEVKGIDFYLESGLLFTEKEGKVFACLPEAPDYETLNALARLGDAFEILRLSEAAYEALKTRFLEVRSGGEIGALEGFEADENIERFLQNGDLLESEDSAPVIRYVNSLFVQALKRNATDIHIEPFEQRGEIRFRIDGVLHRIATLPKRAVESVINRIKVLSSLDISETRIPQDGRTRITVAGAGIDVRVSLMPTYHGEKAVLRLLMQGSAIPSLRELGFSEEVYTKLHSLLRQSYGMILITGPTGSGKSTTLHSFLKEIDHDHFNIVTIENPVEYNAEGVNQVQVNEKVHLTFSEALRAILRQDPDIIMVGEMRDAETAAIATQAAMTGHLLLSTLHTNSALGAIPRLIDLGVDPFLVRSTLIGIVGQRLVRVLCPHCKQPEKAGREEQAYFQLPDDATLYGAVGCERCGQTGYLGRRAIGEIVLMDDGLGAQIRADTDERTLRHYLMERGDFHPMSEALQEMLLRGETSLREAFRIGVQGV